MSERIVCPVCGSELQGPPLEVSRGSRLYQCATCDLQTWEPRHGPGGGWYDVDPHYMSFPVVDWLGWHHREGLALLPSRCRTLLDVGCADGRFVYAAAGRGIDARGIDLSGRLVRLGNERYGGDRLAQVTVEQYSLMRPKPVDAVTLFEVIEHVEDPLDFLRTAIQHVRSEGAVIVSTPNRFGYPKPEKGYDEPPHHFTRWSPRALTALAERAGLEVEEIRICPADVAIKAFLLSRVRLGIVARLLRSRARRVSAGGPDLAPIERRRIRGAIRAKDFVADIAARAAAPLLAPWFPGPAMVMVARRRVADASAPSDHSPDAPDS